MTMATVSAYDRITQRLTEHTGSVPQREGGDWRCPAHQDATPSLSVNRGAKGVILKCQAGCDTEKVVVEIGLTMRDLFDAPTERRPDETIATYRYVDEDGTLLYEVLRKPGKRFVQRRPDGKGGWEWKLGDVRRVLYNLPGVIEAVAKGEPVYVVEGEKDADALVRAGVVATCNSGGACKWRPEFAGHLRGADVVIVPDQDGSGAKHAADVEASLVGVARCVWVLKPAAGKDASDHLEAGYGVGDFLAVDDEKEAAEERDLAMSPSPIAEADGNRDQVDPSLVEAIADDYGITGPEAWRLAETVAGRIHSERATGLARRRVHDERLSKDADLAGIDVATAAEMLKRDRSVRAGVLGDLVLEGHNASIVGAWKTGKSTAVDNAAEALVDAGKWLGRFPVPRPMRVALLNYELVEEDMGDRLAALGLAGDASERLLVVNLRGKRLPLTVPVGRRWLASRLLDHGADVLIVDPFGAAFAAAGGESENDNAEVRRFLITLDEIKAQSGCRTLLMPVHTGRGEAAEGNEQGRGATVLEDWPDVRMVLTKDKAGVRYLRTEGRARWNLHESRLSFDPATRRLTLPSEDVGISRRDARRDESAHLVERLVDENAGVNVTTLWTLLAGEGVTNNDDKGAAIAAAKARRFIHIHAGKGRCVLHHVGAQHPIGDDCPGGWTP